MDFAQEADRGDPFKGEPGMHFGRLFPVDRRDASALGNRRPGEQGGIACGQTLEDFAAPGATQARLDRLTYGLAVTRQHHPRAAGRVTDAVAGQAQGILALGPRLAQAWKPILAAVLLGTMVTLAVTALVFRALCFRRERP